MSNINYGYHAIHATGSERRNMAFVTWLIGWPLSTEVERYLIFLRGITFGADVVQAASVISLAIWIGIAIALYDKRP